MHSLVETIFRNHSFIDFVSCCIFSYETEHIENSISKFIVASKLPSTHVNFLLTNAPQVFNLVKLRQTRWPSNEWF